MSKNKGPTVLECDLAKIAGVKFRQELIYRIYEGYSFTEACAEMGVSPISAALYRKENTDFDNEVRAAQEYQVDILADKLMNIEEHERDPKMARVMSQNIQWLAGKRYRRMYGEKVDVNHHVVVDIRAAMIEAESRTLGFIDNKPLVSLANATDNISVAPRNIIDATIDDDDIDPLS